jgi:hypothetical protein
MWKQIWATGRVDLTLLFSLANVQCPGLTPLCSFVFSLRCNILSDKRVMLISRPRVQFAEVRTRRDAKLSRIHRKIGCSFLFLSQRAWVWPAVVLAGRNPGWVRSPSLIMSNVQGRPLFPLSPREIFHPAFSKLAIWDYGWKALH